MNTDNARSPVVAGREAAQGERPKRPAPRIQCDHCGHSFVRHDYRLIGRFTRRCIEAGCACYDMTSGQGEGVCAICGSQAHIGTPAGRGYCHDCLMDIRAAFTAEQWGGLGT